MKSILALLVFATPLSLGQAPPAPPPSPTPDPPAALALTGPEGKVAPGKLIRVVAKTAAKKVTWRVPAAVDFEPSADTLRIVCAAPVGTYTIEAACPGADGAIAFASLTLTIEAPVPPPPPAPPDTLKLDLGALAKAAPSAERASLGQLAALYRQAAAISAQATDPATLAKQVHDAADTLLPAKALLPLRDRVRVELAKISDGGTLPADWQKRAADVYARAAAAAEDASK